MNIYQLNLSDECFKIIFEWVGYLNFIPILDSRIRVIFLDLLINFIFVDSNIILIVGYFFDKYRYQIDV